MTVFRVPVYFQEQPTKTGWSDISDALGDAARKDMTFTDGSPTVTGVG